MKYEVVIGLEVHVELATQSKMFCSCSTKFGAEPNTQVCPVCLGMPGVLPVPNDEAITFAIRAGLALGCQIATVSKFDRKNYFYPDNPKAYQISQYDEPVCYDGELFLNLDGEPKRIGITRAHLEEDAGKLVHENGVALVDFNRAGVPLLEIVSEPDMRSPEEAKTYLQELRTIIQYMGVSDVRMEQGSMRADANVSLRPLGQKEYGTRAEIKNLNSFRALERAINYEIERQTKVLDQGERVIQETRGWDDGKGITFSLRSKEEAQDYRYFPDPDLRPLLIAKERIEKERENLPELPAALRERLIQEDGLPEYDVLLLTESPDKAAFYKACRQLGAEAKTTSNWMMGELFRLLNQEQVELQEAKIKPEQLVTIMKLVESKKITQKAGKEVVEEVFRTGKDPEKVVSEKGLSQISDESVIVQAVQKAIEQNPDPVADYRAGKEKALAFLIGQVMKETRGRANPGRLREILLEQLQ